MLMGQCNKTDPRQLGWSLGTDGLVRTDRDMCITTLWPMFQASRGR